MCSAAAEAIGFQAVHRRSRLGLTFADLAGVAIRRNPKRAHLIVSRVLAKHVPVAGAKARCFGSLLAHEVTLARGRSSTRAPLVLGFAETACGLAGTVADALPGATLTQTTRDLAGAPEIWLSFEESHSHAPSQFLLSGVRDSLLDSGDVVIVDDELSTGATVWNLIERMDRAFPHRRYVVACLIDARSDVDRQRLEENVHTTGVDVKVVSLLDVQVLTAKDAVRRASAYVDRLGVAPVGTARIPPPRVREVPVDSVVVPDARQGAAFSARERAFRSVERQLADFACGHLKGRTLVIGVEESIYPAIRAAAAIGADVQSTTRSPAVVIDRDDYPIRTGITFPSAYAPDIPAFLYNGPATTSDPRYDDAVLLLPTPMNTSKRGASPGLLAAAGSCCSGTVWTLGVCRGT